MLLFHGTTLTRFKKAINDGFLGTEDTVWNVSESNTTYFWSEKYIKSEFDAETKEDILRIGIQNALESADLTLGMERRNLKRVVLIFESRDLKKLGPIEKDDSCGENMEYCLKFSGKIPLSHIKRILIDKEALDMLALYFIGCAYNRCTNNGEYALNTDFSDLEQVILEAAKTVFNSEGLAEYFLENLDVMEVLEETSVAELKQLLKNEIGERS